MIHLSTLCEHEYVHGIQV